MIEKSCDRLALMVKRATSNAEETRLNGAALTLSACKLSPDAIGALETTVTCERFPQSQVSQLRQAVAFAPSVPGLEFFQALGALPVLQSVDFDSDDNPIWVAPVAANRATFKRAVFRFGVGPDASFYKFLYAMQTPHIIVFAPLQEVEAFVPCDILDMASLDNAYQRFVQTFVVDYASFVTADMVPAMAPSQISLMGQADYVGGNTIASHSCWERLDTVLAGLPARAAFQPKTHEPKWHENKKLVTPWLKGKLQSEHSDAPRSGDSGGDCSDRTAKEFTDEELDALFSELAHSRESSDVASGPVVDFKVCVLGGLWTMIHLGRSHDAYQGKVCKSTGAAANFVDSYGMQKSARFNVDLYGEKGSRTMATAS
jgi:hypothetical protein